MGSLRDFFKKYQRHKAIEFLKTADPEKIVTMGRDLLLPAFKRAAQGMPAYKKILAERGADYKKIKTIADFEKNVPLISKHEIFSRFDIAELCVGGSLKDAKTFMTSSGFSGEFSFGINTVKNQKKIAESIDLGLELIFNISRQKTLFISCLPMGVKVFTSLPLAETSVRHDMALAIIKKISPKFEQTILLGDPHFLKKLVEDEVAAGIDWQKLKISLIYGEDWASDSFRYYLANLINLDLAKSRDRFLGATLGVAELDLNLFHESRFTILIRHAAQQDAKLRQALFGENIMACPTIFHYYPHRIFLEALPKEAAVKELAFSMLSPATPIPLMRYNSGDRCWLYSYGQMKEILTSHGYEDLIPEVKLPLVAVGGRQDKFLEVDGRQIYPEEIKQGLYENFEVAGKTTGYFRLSLSEKNRRPQLEIQLKPDVTVSQELKSKFKSAALKYVNADLPVILYAYRDFPYGMELDYEKKFKCI